MLLKTKRQESINTLALALLIVGAVFICFLPVRDFAFINFDDDLYITNNWFVRAGFTSASIIQAFQDTSTGHWHPFTWLSYMLDTELFSISPGATHLINAALHALSAGLLFLVLHLITRSTGKSLTVALLFGLHPMRLESVAWASQRKDVLSLLLGLITLLLYFAWTNRKRWYWLMATTVMFTAALLAKPTLITLPILCLCLDFWPLKRLSRSALLEKIPLFLVAAVFAGIVVFSQHAGAGLRDISEVSFANRVSNAMVGFLAYFGKLYIPTGFGVFYPIATYAPGIGAGCFLAIIALTNWFYRDWKTKPYLAMGWTWFVISLIPVIGFIQVGGQTFADRWTYLPHIGLLIASVWYVAEWIERSKISPRTVQIFCAALSVLICVYVTELNLPYWKDSETLFQHTLDVSPNNFMAHTNLGTALDVSGKLDDAAIHFEEAVRLNPTYPEALNNLGSLKARQNKLPEAAEFFRRALSIRPNFSAARYHLGLAQHSLGYPLIAASEWVRVLANEPDFSRARESLDFLVKRGLLAPCSDTSPQTQSGRIQLSQALNSWKPAGDRQLYDALVSIANCKSY